MIDRLKDAWAWLNDDRDMVLADEAAEAADLLPSERALVVVVHLLFAALAYFACGGTLALIAMMALAPALVFEQPLLVIAGALPAPVVWASVFKARRLLKAWILRSIAARTSRRAAIVLEAIAASGQPIAVPVDVERADESS